MVSWVASIASRRLASSALFALALLPLGCASSHEGSGELPFYNTADFTAEWIDKDARAGQKLHTIAPFSFVDQDGRAVTNASLKGKVYVADFFFTSCPVMCPKMTATFKTIQAAFAGDPGVALVSHTVDPSSDTPEHLGEFARKEGIKGDQWHLVTGDAEAIYGLARTSYFAEKRIGLSKGKNELLHTENMILVDRDGHIRGIYNATLPAEAKRIIEDIRALKNEG